MVLAVPPLWVLSPPLPYRVCCCPVLSEATALLVYYQLMQPQRKISTSGLQFLSFRRMRFSGMKCTGSKKTPKDKEDMPFFVRLKARIFSKLRFEWFGNSDQSKHHGKPSKKGRKYLDNDGWLDQEHWALKKEALIFQFQAINRDKKQAVLQRVDQIVCCLLKKWGLTVFNSWRTCSSTPSFKKDSLTFFITSSMTDLYNFGWKWNAHQFYPNFSQIPIKQTKNTYHWIWSWHAL